MRVDRSRFMFFVSAIAGAGSAAGSLVGSAGCAASATKPAEGPPGDKHAETAASATRLVATTTPPASAQVPQKPPSFRITGPVEEGSFVEGAGSSFEGSWHAQEGDTHSASEGRAARVRVTGSCTGNDSVGRIVGTCALKPTGKGGSRKSLTKLAFKCPSVNVRFRQFGTFGNVAHFDRQLEYCCRYA